MNKLDLARLSLTGIVLALGACGGGGSGDNTNKAAISRYLNVSVPEFYFGTRDVGTTATQQIELLNRSGDIYPITGLSLNGSNADEFALEFSGGVTLNPSEKVAFDVSFAPLTDGLKNAEIKVVYDIISQVTDADNVNEQLYYDAQDLEQQQDYDKSLRRYQSYMQSDPVTVNKKRAAIKLPVLSESQRYGEGRDFDHYLAALNHRNEGDTERALDSLNTLLSEHPDSYLADDALYLKGYIQLIDNKNYAAAQQHMARLQRQHPESTYQDTALYSEALALEEQGDGDQAETKYRELLARHRSGTWAALNLNLAKDNFNSRLWFDRANQGLSRLAG